MARYQWNLRPRRAGATPLASGLVCAAVVTLALLNPLACLIHCAALQLQAQRAEADRTADGAGIFFCHRPLAELEPRRAPDGSRLASAPTTLLPRAVYDAVAHTALALAPLLLLLALLAARETSPLSWSSPPQAPPPRPRS